MDIEYLGEFIYLAETLSYKKTAEHFYVSRSVISRHILALEETVGVRLLDRDSHVVKLTDAGEVFYREALTISRDWEMALERTRDIATGSQTLVRLGYLRNAARPVLSRFVREMNRRFPSIKLSLVCMDYGELAHALAEHVVDVALAVSVSSELSKNYRHSPIYKDRFTVVCSKEHPLAVKEGGLSLEDLRGERLLLPDSYVYGGTSDFIREYMDEKTMELARSSYEDADMLMLKVETEGILAFSSTMNNEMFGERFAILPILDADTSFQVSAFYHDDFSGHAFEACCEAFEWVNDMMCEWSPELALNDCR